MATRKSGLGRGLEALLGGRGGAEPSTLQAATPAEMAGQGLRRIAIGMLGPGKYQPRTAIDVDRLTELAESIKAQGVIQPIVVRSVGPGRYELIAGERRWRAAQKAGLVEIPALVKVVQDQAVVAMALIENIQREDLSPLEEAQALSRLIQEFGLTHQQAAEAVGRSRAAVSNLLRLLDLPADIKRLLDDRELEMGHARALATLPEKRAIALALEAAEKGWSVRELEDAVRRAEGGGVAKAGKPATKIDPNIAALERDLAEKLATRVQLAHARNGRGKLVIHYHSLDELDGILERIR